MSLIEKRFLAVKSKWEVVPQDWVYDKMAKKRIKSWKEMSPG